MNELSLQGCNSELFNKQMTTIFNLIIEVEFNKLIFVEY